MSILDLCNAGSVLEKPIPSSGIKSPKAEKALRKQILKDCLPAQKEFLEDETHRMLSYIGGFGSGKSWALAAKLIFLGLRNPGTTMMACEPTFVMVRQVLMPALDNAFDQWGVELGKRLAQQVLTALESQPSSAALDPSTAQLIARIRASRAGKK